MRFLPLMLLCGLFFLLPGMSAHAAADAEPAATATASDAQFSSEAVMQQFAGDAEEAPERRIETKRKHEILFFMGISLLVLLFLTGALGIAMVVFDRDVFVAHLICAGLSLTLAAAHAATSIAWFWPF
jgi:hypothetical protein